MTGEIPADIANIPTVIANQLSLSYIKSNETNLFTIENYRFRDKRMKHLSVLGLNQSW